MKEMIVNDLFFGIVISFIAFEIGKFIFKKTQSPIFNPLLIGTLIVIAILKTFDISTDSYFKGASIINFFLGPATVALALPLYKQWNLFKKYFIPVMTGAIIGSFIGIISVILLGKLLDVDKTLLYSFMPKSITTPIGIEVSSILGGIPSLTVLGIILTGITGNVSAPFICKIFRIKHSVAKGIGIGVASHAVGTSKAMEMGEVEGSMSALSIVFAGILTLIWAPILKFLV
ncbi:MULTISPECIES: LrgB family protein [Fusobacterium]|uniref:LrgB family protein n=2 Tax=Fusobacteriaceae TaxID=203492 RepID=UPI0025C41CAC|nr:LrgB family protein [Fusobacterium sp.]MCI7222693.1 LrgB family protein [Fusobacterium sp.]MDD7391631.1 LrgB family protein [Fusobacteriaceae bacterium]MDY5305704.1 LrgB family protein [Fusobacterium gastrosuis]MDY5794780.1 LrgB family protein [Fusobacterium gastrosuis]